MAQLSPNDKAVLNCIFNPNLPFEEFQDNDDLKDNVDSNPEIKKLEVAAIKLAEDGKLDEALNILNDALKIGETASVYNNRAQVFQYLKRFEEALADVNKSIELSGPDQKRTLANALCQRGLLYRRENRMEEAREDFGAAAELGSQFAKTQLVELNPYAALCNQMLRKVFNDLQK